MPHVTLSFDYDSPAGYRESFHMKDTPLDADMRGTERILKVLRAHDVKATFGVVAEAALDGAPPEHCADQIRRIFSQGHEIASHSLNHRYLPSMDKKELFDNVHQSKRILENCIGGQIRGFIPPFNRPMHFPSRGAFSVSECLGLMGRGRGRQSVASMLQTLQRSGYGWSRVSYENKLVRLLRLFGISSKQIPTQPFIVHNIVAIPLHVTGFGTEPRQLIEKFSETDLVLAIYGHPNQASAENTQNADQLESFLESVQEARAADRLQFHTMEGIERLVRNRS